MERGKGQTEDDMNTGTAKTEIDVAERVKEQEFEAGFLHGWDGSECIYYTDEKCLYYNDAEAPCHHCHHYARKTQQKREQSMEYRMKDCMPGM